MYLRQNLIARWIGSGMCGEAEGPQAYQSTLASYPLEQGCTTYGPRRPLIWPAKPKIYCIHLVCLKEKPIEWVKTYTFWPFDEIKKIWARHEI